MPDLSHQFQLFEPPSGAAAKTEWPDVNKELTPTGDLPYQRTLSWRDVPISPHYPNDTQRIKPEVGNWRRKPNNEPMAMFHTAREITEGWRPHEGDRRYLDTMIPAGGKRAPKAIVRGVAVSSEDRPLVPVETDEQLMERKLYEATSIGYADRGGYQQTLAQHLSSGGMHNIQPIPLGHLANPVDKHLDPRPMVAGGQHRIAAMMHLNPDQLLPVVHHEDIIEAKLAGGYT